MKTKTGSETIEKETINEETVEEEAVAEATVKEETVKEETDKEKTDKEKKKEKKRVVIVSLLSFAIPFALMAAAFALFKISPFYPVTDTASDGSLVISDKVQQMLNYDLWHQYFPFLQIFRQKLAEGGSMFYSWITGMGSNFLSIIAYYVASPLNLLSVLVPEEYLREFLTVCTLVKIGTAGLFFSIFVRKIFRRADMVAVTFSCFYALSAFATGYYWNVIWLDTFALFPLVMLGAWELFTKSKFKLYTVTLALSIITNYYIGYMVCVFMVISFISFAVLFRPKMKEFFKKLGLFALSSATGGLMSGFIAVPAFFALMGANGATQGYYGGIRLYRGFEEIIADLFPFHQPEVIDGLPNIFCGLATLILVFMFFWNTKIALREKMVGLAVSLFMILSLNLNFLDFFWHGLHFPNQVPHRFGFIVSFVLLFIALRAYQKSDSLDKWDVIGTSVFFALAVGACAVAVFGKAKLFEKEAVSPELVLAGGAFLGTIYIVLMFAKYKGYVNSKGLSLLLCAIAFVEIIPCSVLGVHEVGTTSYKYYLLNSPKVETVQEYALNEDPENATQFYRSDFVKGWSCNDPALFMYNGITQFSSTANVGVTTLLHSLGLPADEASNRYAYMLNTPVTNAFLNLKYIMDTSSVSKVDQNLIDKLYTADGMTIYKNDAWLPLAFMTAPQIEGFEPDKIDCFETQNRLFSLATGIGENVMVRLEPVQGASDSVTVRKVTEDDQYWPDYNYRYDTVKGSDGYVMEVDAEITQSGKLYGYITIPGTTQVEVLRNGSSDRFADVKSARTEQAAVYLGDFEKGQTLTLRAQIDSVYINGYCNIQLAVFDRDLFLDGYELLNRSTLHMTKFEDTRIEGSVTAESDGVLYTSIPYEKGWTVTVDGEKAETFAIGGAFVGVKGIKAGTHEVTFDYVPTGFVSGVILSAIGIIVFIAACIVTRKHPIAYEPVSLPEPLPRKSKKKKDSDREPEESADVGANESEPDEDNENGETGNADAPEDGETGGGTENVDAPVSETEDKEEEAD
ncbi:MAG: YfhO family protein [Clostridia bacterium]|nr:YfhO family protein [Clostridia bacterium]